MTPVFPPGNLRSQLVLWRKSGHKRWMVCFQFVISGVCLNTILEWTHLLWFCFGLLCALHPHSQHTIIEAHTNHLNVSAMGFVRRKYNAINTLNRSHFSLGNKNIPAIFIKKCWTAEAEAPLNWMFSKHSCVFFCICNTDWLQFVVSFSFSGGAEKNRHC